VYEAVKQIHITRFPTTNFVSGLQRRGREKKRTKKKKTNNVLLHIKYSIPDISRGFFDMSTASYSGVMLRLYVVV
jgi:hypothetical protein